MSASRKKQRLTGLLHAQVDARDGGATHGPAIAWVRRHPDGEHAGELTGDWLWDGVIEQCRKDSGVWFPIGALATHAGDAAPPANQNVDERAAVAFYAANPSAALFDFERRLKKRSWGSWINEPPVMPWEHVEGAPQAVGDAKPAANVHVPLARGGLEVGEPVIEFDPDFERAMDAEPGRRFSLFASQAAPSACSPPLLYPMQPKGNRHER
jgi:hypothetical protein